MEDLVILGRSGSGKSITQIIVGLFWQMKERKKYLVDIDAVVMKLQINLGE
jgi:ABC-type glutathione transport system ATPase component